MGRPAGGRVQRGLVGQLEMHEDRDYAEFGIVAIMVCPAWAMTWRCESTWNQVAGTKGKRKVLTVREVLKEAWNAPVSRRTGIG